MYRLLEAPDRLGWAIREGGHGHYPADFEALLDFADIHLRGRGLRRNFQRPLYPQLDELLERRQALPGDPP